ncbi:MAG: pirin family protein [Euryarchaeota archaeon]|nr:pirin family protein [Euryarchaeota archaeon]
MFKEQKITIIPSEKRHSRDFGWLKTNRLFSFGDYQDHSNLSFGNLRVFNDDIVQPGKGYSDHRHTEMEIITILLDGEMMYEDSVGNKCIMSRDQVHRISAGTGVIHSGFNHGCSPAHIYEIWICPNIRGLLPSYAYDTFPAKERQSCLQVLASGEGLGGLDMFADATIYACNIGDNEEIGIYNDNDRLLFIYLTNGSAELNGHEVKKNDQVRMSGSAIIQSKEGAEIIIIDMPDVV